MCVCGGGSGRYHTGTSLRTLLAAVTSLCLSISPLQGRAAEARSPFVTFSSTIQFSWMKPSHILSSTSSGGYTSVHVGIHSLTCVHTSIMCAQLMCMPAHTHTQSHTHAHPPSAAGSRRTHINEVSEQFEGTVLEVRGSLGKDPMCSYPMASW